MEPVELEETPMRPRCLHREDMDEEDVTKGNDGAEALVAARSAFSDEDEDDVPSSDDASDDEPWLKAPCRSSYRSSIVAESP